jgi:flavin reductase (DIM6/NTAB) family NADH-FMN oxidoreductase RutF
MRSTPTTEPAARQEQPAELVGREAFRAVMGGICTPVSIITTHAGARPHGTTVSAFASLSLDPPMVLVSLDRSSELLAHLRVSRRFGLNVLAADQSELATRFARKGPDKFADVGWESIAGLPHLDGVTGFLACAITDLVDGGDHVVVFAHVQHAQERPAAPLLYHRQQFDTRLKWTEPA